MEIVQVTNNRGRISSYYFPFSSMKCDHEFIGKGNGATGDKVSILKLNEHGALQILVLQ